MKTLLVVRLFIAVFVTLFGLGLMFIRSEDTRIMVGATFAALGITSLILFFIVLRER